ncbi:hypothetical protein [Jannaschia seohaensis]|uniref:Glycosyl transferase family 8 n=1 Tax=Jannaschia seohaensis TaxID=475081 RepID=A0A2Y9AQ88_9RHOB|nr:hypothetical protein [Jannaschia seohaensis]PWJ20511.1 hypothetical protein BCF38_103330 [Jannaschia seohaensis]SSA44607.1 hypothetical protein SAMN05421539_103330 [Jannaschia seohaensis]
MTLARPEAPAAQTRLRKWYFCANDGALGGDNFRLLRAAIHSCLRHTDLLPHCLYVGRTRPALDKLREMGVTVIRHMPSLEPELRRAYGADYETFAGHWLRLDIPRIETEDAVVLYTDIDVLFRPLPPRLARPRLLAVAPERWRAARSHFNSGVMLMNLDGLRGVDDAFRAAIRARLAGDFTWPTHDQASFNAFFRGRTDPLPLEMNWKPYWGVGPETGIVHFHGPKPRIAAALAQNGPAGLDPTQARLHALAPAAYAHYGALYRSELAEPPATGDAPPVYVVDDGGPTTEPALRAVLRDARHWAEDGLRAGLGRLREIRSARRV